MSYLDLSTEVNPSVEPITMPRLGRPPLSPKLGLRRETLIKHLLNPALVAETADLLEQQYREIHEAFAPRNGWQDWLSSVIATLVLRISRSERIERKLRDMASYRAIDFWEDDQALAVETLAVKIAKEPAKVVAKLRETPSGIDWLLARWRILAQVKPEDWSDAQRELALRLVGGNAAVDPSKVGFVDDQIVSLEAYRERVVEADAITRGLVEMDLHDDGVPGLSKLRRYVRSLHRQLKWYIDQFHVDHSDRWDDPRRRSADEGPAYERYRPRNPNLFEGKEEPQFYETKPTESVAEITSNHEIDETKPLLTADIPQNDETKPFEPVNTLETAPVAVAPEPPVIVHDYSNEKGRNHSRALRAGEPSREYARRQKAARRQTNLALAELV